MSRDNESACNAGTAGDSLIPGLGRSPGGGHGNPLKVFLPREFHGERSLAGCRSWGCKELDRTDCHFHFVIHTAIYIDIIDINSFILLLLIKKLVTSVFLFSSVQSLSHV